MTHNLTIVPAVLIAGAIALLAIVLLTRPAPVVGGSFPLAPAFQVATTSTAVSVTASTRILATTTNLVGTGFTRAYAVICNPSATIVQLRLDGDKPVNNNGISIGAAAGHRVCYELTDDRMVYVGSIQASSTAGAVTLQVNQYVY
jgi:hypothetical protein